MEAQLKAAATEKKPPRWYMTFLSQFHALWVRGGVEGGGGAVLQQLRVRGREGFCRGIISLTHVAGMPCIECYYPQHICCTCHPRKPYGGCVASKGSASRHGELTGRTERVGRVVGRSLALHKLVL